MLEPKHDHPVYTRKEIKEELVLAYNTYKHSLINMFGWKAVYLMDISVQKELHVDDFQKMNEFDN